MGVINEETDLSEDYSMDVLQGVNNAGADSGILPFTANKAAEKSEYKYEEKPGYEAAKRFFDIILALIGLAIASPVMLVTAFAIKREDGGSAVFRQPRIGKQCRVFYMYKFRSMYNNAEDMLKKLSSDQKQEFLQNFKLKDDPRITKVGKFIRKTSIDELPQLLNILRGEMSFVGPRPPLLAEEEAYGSSLSRIMSVRPGLTGYWQVNGRSNTSFKERIEMTEYYIDKRCLKLDIKIMLQTVSVVISKRGAE